MHKLLSTTLENGIFSAVPSAANNTATTVISIAQRLPNVNQHEILLPAKTTHIHFNGRFPGEPGLAGKGGGNH